MRHSFAYGFVMFVFASLCVGQNTSPATGNAPLLLRQPAVSKTQIVFNYAGDLWIVARDGGDARRLTSAVGTATNPSFSPDGTWIAFTGNFAGNPDVYVVAATGGQPRRLTYHPGTDQVVGWTPDGKRIVFGSARSSYYRFSGRFQNRLRSAWHLAAGVETLSGRSNSPDLDSSVGRFEHCRSRSAREFKR
jgi:tricorn protease-like protein